MNSGLTSSHSLPFLKPSIIHSKQIIDMVPKPSKYPLFERTQTIYNKAKSRSPLKINPAIQQTYAKYKVQGVQSYHNQLFQQYLTMKTQKRVEEERKLQIKWRQERAQAEKAKISYLQCDYFDDLQKPEFLQE